MTVLTAERDTIRRGGDSLSLKAAAGKIYYAGSLAARDANGRATPGASGLGLMGVGRVRETVDNSAGLDDAADVAIERGIYRFANEPTDPVAAADIGSVCYIVDDQTVAKTDGTASRSIAGRVIDVDTQGVWVQFEGTKFITAAASLDFPSIAAVTSADLTIAVPGAETGDAVALGQPAAPAAGLIYQAFVSAAGIVTVRATNITAAAIDPLADTFRVTVAKG